MKCELLVQSSCITHVERDTLKPGMKWLRSYMELQPRIRNQAFCLYSAVFYTLSLSMLLSWAHDPKLMSEMYPFPGVSKLRVLFSSKIRKKENWFYGVSHTEILHGTKGLGMGEVTLKTLYSKNPGTFIGGSFQFELSHLNFVLIVFRFLIIVFPL